MKLVLIKLSRTSDVVFGKIFAFIGSNKVFECSTSEPLFEHAENPEGLYSLKVDWDTAQGKSIVAKSASRDIYITTPTRRPDKDKNYIYIVKRTCLDDKDALYESACSFTLDSLITSVAPIEKCTLNIIDVSKG